MEGKRSRLENRIAVGKCWRSRLENRTDLGKCWRSKLEFATKTNNQKEHSMFAFDLVPAVTCLIKNDPSRMCSFDMTQSRLWPNITHIAQWGCT